MKVLEIVQKDILAPVLVAILAPLVVGLFSTLRTGQWSSYFDRIPVGAWAAFAVLVVVWLIYAFVRRRRDELRQLDSGVSAFVVTTPLYGWRAIMEFSYADVTWRVRGPRRTPFDDRTLPSEVEVETPPRCPECKTELEQRHRFWGGYLWWCVGCSFRRKSRESYYREPDRAQRIANRWLEEELGRESDG